MENLIYCILFVAICLRNPRTRRICAGITGFTWGLFAGVLLRSNGFIYGFFDGKALIDIFVYAAVIALLSAMYERFGVCVNCFHFVFYFGMTYFLLYVDIMMITLLAITVAVTAYNFYRYADIFISAVAGALLFSTVVFNTVDVDNKIIIRCVIVVVSTAIGWIQFKRFSGDDMVVRKIDPILKEDADLLLAPVIAFVLNYWVFEPVWGEAYLYNVGENAISVNGLIGMAFTGITIGSLVFIVVNKDIKYNLIYQIPYAIWGIRIIIFMFHITSDLSWEMKLPVIRLQLIGIFQFLILWLILYFLNKVIKNDKIIPLFLSSIAVFLWYFVFEWLGGYVLWNVSTWIMDGISIVLVAASVWILFWKKCKVNIFRIK